MTLCEAIRQYRNENNQFAAMMGIETIELTEGYAKSAMSVRPEFENAIQSVHGGCLFTLADTTSGAAAASRGWKQTTLSGDLNYLKPAIGASMIYAEANEIKRGKTISVYNVTLTDDAGKKIATGTFTFFNLGERLLKEEPLE